MCLANTNTRKLQIIANGTNLSKKKFFSLSCARVSFVHENVSRTNCFVYLFFSISVEFENEIKCKATGVLETHAHLVMAISLFPFTILCSFVLILDDTIEQYLKAQKRI